MSQEGHGGFWNRAGRRSGGYAPHKLDIVTPFLCGHCGAECWPAMLEKRIVQVGAVVKEVGLCPVCRYVVTERAERDA